MQNMPNFLYVIKNKIPRHFTQVLATLAVSLGPFAAGLGKGYSSPALASLQQSQPTNFHVSAQEGSWVASLSLLGALFGCLFGGMILQLGRKMSLLLVALPFSGSWLLTVFAQRVEMMYSTSFIGGFFSAVTLLATQVYVSEISHPEIRGCLSAVLKMAGHLGTLSSFALGAFLDWRQLATVAAGAPILLFLAILPIPETPSFLLYHGREEEACKSMTWLRSPEEDIVSELETLRGNIITKQKSFLPRCSGNFPFRQLLITCGLMFFQKFSGVTVFFHYAVQIFSQVFGRALNPHGAAIVVQFLQLLGSMTSGLLIDTAGRLPLLTISNLFISGGFFGFGLYNYLEVSLPPSYPGFSHSLDWIPLTCVLFFTLFFSIGIGPISWLMVGELFPLEYRGFGAAVSTSFSYACAFTAVKTYVDIRSHIGLYGTFWIYSAISVAGLFFACCVVPETKGVELEEMGHHEVNCAVSSPHASSTNNNTAPDVTQKSKRQPYTPNISCSTTTSSHSKELQKCHGSPSVPTKLPKPILKSTTGPHKDASIYRSHKDQRIPHDIHSTNDPVGHVKIKVPMTNPTTSASSSSKMRLFDDPMAPITLRQYTKHKQKERFVYHHAGKKLPQIPSSFHPNPRSSTRSIDLEENEPFLDFNHRLDVSLTPPSTDLDPHYRVNTRNRSFIRSRYSYYLPSTERYHSNLDFETIPLNSEDLHLRMDLMDDYSRNTSCENFSSPYYDDDYLRPYFRYRHYQRFEDYSDDPYQFKHHYSTVSSRHDYRKARIFQNPYHRYSLFEEDLSGYYGNRSNDWVSEHFCTYVQDAEYYGGGYYDSFNGALGRYTPKTGTAV